MLADEFVGHGFSGYPPFRLPVLEDALEEEPSVNHPRGDLHHVVYLGVFIRVREGILAGRHESPQVLLVHLGHIVAQPGVLERKLNVASSQSVFMSRNQPQVPIESPVIYVANWTG